MEKITPFQINLMSMIHNLIIDCKGEGCDEEETLAVIGAFLDPMIDAIKEDTARARAIAAEEEACTLP